MDNSTLYQVFEVDDCFEDYAMGYRLIGAIDIEDLKTHLADIMMDVHGKREGKRIAKLIITDAEWRIKQMDNLYTTAPYVILGTFSYIE